MIIESPHVYTMEQVTRAQRIQISHAQEMEAVRITLLMCGAEYDEFYHYLPLITPDQVIVEMHQDEGVEQYLVKMFSDTLTKHLH